MELFKLLGTIAVDNSGANSAIDGTADKAEKAEGRMSKAFSGVGKGAVALGKVIASGVAVGATAIGALAKQSLDAYADYEQLTGGVETLFKDASEQLMGFANVAYKTAGLSANEYMETVTSFSASLIQSLNGDTAKASEVANQAIIDMSDNANKMGTSMESIQNAYQGFAKQNYTMLDNLKLGYGGTKEEMARLLRDAKAISGIDYDISSYADVVEAIHVIQNEMGITGTTAKEASATISGSLTAMKSAWQNLLTGIADENQDLEALMGNFFDSVGTAMENIVPRVEVILGNIGGMLIDFVGEKLFGVSNSSEIVFATISQKFNELCTFLGEAWNTHGRPVLDAIKTAWTTVGQPIWDMISFTITSVANLFAENMPAIKAFFSDAIAGIKDTWENHLKPCFEAIGTFLNEVVKPAFEYVWQTIIEPIIKTVFTTIADLWNNFLKPVFDGICDFLTGVFSGDWKKAFDGLGKIVDGVFNGICTVLEGAWNVIKTVINQIIGGIEWMVNKAKDGINGIINGINSLIGKAGAVVGIEIAIPTIPDVNLPRLEKGGVLEKGQVGLLEGNGAEAVVPLDQNDKWINRVAQDMNSAVGSNEVMYKIHDALNSLPDEIAEAIASMRFEINNREFARLVKGV